MFLHKTPVPYTEWQYMPNQFLIVATIVGFWLFLGYELTSDFLFKETGEYGNSYAYDGCNVVGINAHGTFLTYKIENNSDTGQPTVQASSEEIIFAIEQADAQPNIEGILLDIDSYGGSPVAAEEVANALKKTTKPTVALIRQAGTSAAYWAATGADQIITSALSDVGSIGVTFSYVDAAKYNEKEGFTFNQLSTGVYKDYGNPNKPLTNAERDLIVRDLELIKDAFVKTVAENRNIDIAKVEQLADGSSMLGEAALKEGLIDQIGSYTEAKKYLEDQMGVPVTICW